jgi:hypothetical protein
MAVNVVEYITKMQQEGLATLKQSQDANIAAMTQFRSIGKDFAAKPGTLPTFENIPTATQFVEMSFAFAAQFLELRKAYTLQIAEMLVDTQKQAEATMKQAASTVTNATTAPMGTTTVSNGTVPPAAAKPAGAK